MRLGGTLYSILAVGLLPIVALAGCLQSEEPPVVSPANSDPTDQSTGDFEVTPDKLEGMRRILLGPCEGAHSHVIVPASAVSARPPETWGPGPTPVTELGINFHRCDRFSLDGFERGPVSMILEVHGNREPPESCIGDYTTSEILTQIWIDDKELSDYLRDVYSMPAEFAEISLVSQENETVETFEVIFSANGSQASYFTEHRALTDGDGQLTLEVRRYWQNREGGISYMDFQDEFTGPSQILFPIMSGEVHQPFLYANLGAATYTPLGGFYKVGHIEADIYQFSDLACTEPLP